jgi:hypothetical protein
MSTSHHNLPYHPRPSKPVRRTVLIPAFHGRTDPDAQALLKIWRHQSALWDEVRRGDDSRFATAVRERDYHYVVEFLSHEPYLLVCWIVVMSGRGSQYLIPAEQAP